MLKTLKNTYGETNSIITPTQKIIIPEGGGGGWLHIFFWYGCTPWKPKESPKPGQVFSQLTNPNPGQIIYIIKMRPKAGETWFLCKLTYSSVPNKRGGGGGRLLIFDFVNRQDRLLRPPPPPPPNINCYALGNETLQGTFRKHMFVYPASRR